MTEEEMRLVQVVELQDGIKDLISCFERLTEMIVEEVFVGRQGSILTGVYIEVRNDKDN